MSHRRFRLVVKLHEHLDTRRNVGNAVWDTGSVLKHDIILSFFFFFWGGGHVGTLCLYCTNLDAELHPSCNVRRWSGPDKQFPVIHSPLALGVYRKVEGVAGCTIVANLCSHVTI